MKFPITSWIVFMHNLDVGTFSPAFPDLDSAEEFSNAMRILLDNTAVSEPVPLMASQSINLSGSSSRQPCID